MNRNLIVVLVVLAALVGAYFIWRGKSGRKSPGNETTNRGAATGTSTISAGSGDPRATGTSPTRARSDGTNDDPAANATPFQKARARAMTTLQAELTQRVSICAPRASNPPRPRPIRLLLERRPEASTPEMQQYMVKEVTLVAANADDITTEVRACIEQLRGIPVVVFVNPEALAPGDQTMDATFEIPLP